jgi:hypothetical protein
MPANPRRALFKRLHPELDADPADLATFGLAV